MIRYTRIGEHAWESLAKSINSRQDPTPQELRTSLESLEFHQYQLDQWQQSIPDELKFNHADSADTKSTLLLTVLHLRANQMRAVMIRPFLFAGTETVAQLGKSIAAVDIANDTIQTITDLHARTDIYRRQQALFNYFMISALGVLYALIARDYKEETASLRSDRLSPDAFDKAKRGLLCGLYIVRSLGASATYPKRMWNKLFPSISTRNAFPIHGDDTAESVDYLSERSCSFPIAETFESRNQQSLPLDPLFPVSNWSAVDIPLQSSIQTYPNWDSDISNLLNGTESIPVGEVFFDRLLWTAVCELPQ